MPISATARAAHFLLRASVAFAFAYPAISAWSEPFTWLGYVPGFARDMAAMVGMSDILLLHAFGVLELVIALWLLSGWRIFLPSVAAAGLLLFIVVVNPSEFPILFRDLSIAGLALGLALMHAPRALAGQGGQA